MAAITLSSTDISARLTKVRSIKGVGFGNKLIRAITNLIVDNDYNIILMDRESLSRSIQFFDANADNLVFLNKEGQIFEYDKTNRFRNYDIFVGISFSTTTKDATIYAYFPFDGALK